MSVKTLKKWLKDNAKDSMAVIWTDNFNRFPVRMSIERGVVVCRPETEAKRSGDKSS